MVRQLGYLFNYRTNIEDLDQQVVKLRNAWARHQHSVDEAKRNGHKIEDDVLQWFARADEFLPEASIFLDDEKEGQGRKSCFDLIKSRYQQSWKASKKTRKAVEIHEDGQFQTV